jgi:hypothetical protein
MRAYLLKEYHVCQRSAMRGDLQPFASGVDEEKRSSFARSM